MIRQLKANKKFTLSIGTALALIVGLCITTFAILFPNVKVDGNLFQTGTVNINLNDGKPVIRNGEFLFEPGMTVVKDFFVENESTCTVYYRLYLENVEGDLADVLDITIKDGSKTLFSGTALQLAEKSTMANEILAPGERHSLTATFYFPRSAGNETASGYLSFDLQAGAVQTKNNPDGRYE